MENKRKLASIQRISQLIPIAGADRIEVAQVQGWKTIVKKGEFNVGDLGVFFEIDSFLPASDTFSFLGEPKDYIGFKGYRLKTMKMRGVISQGLMLPISIFPELPKDLSEGTDVTELLGVIKYDNSNQPGNHVKSPGLRIGQTSGKFPSYIPKTDQERCQNLLYYWKLYKDATFEETLKLDGCFLGSQFIETWDSGTVAIRDIVSKGVRPILIGMDINGNVVPCTVTNVFNNGPKDTWVDIRFLPHEKSLIVGKSGKLRTTPNHKIFLSDFTEVSASDLCAGDKIIMQSEELDDNGIHYIMSALLGDGSIGTNKHYAYSESHYTKVDEYNHYIMGLFPASKLSTRIQTSGYGSNIRHIKVFKTPKLKQLRNMWYNDSGKKLPEDLSWIDDFTIAKWYTDDGSLAHSEKQNDRANFATNAFNRADVTRLANKLRELYNVDVTVYNSKGWCIRVNYCKGTIDTMWAAIAPHIHDNFLYKLPEKFRNRVFKPYPKITCRKHPIAVEVVSVTPVAYTKKNFPKGSIAFDIETTTHNYFCGGVLVHNSSLTAFKIPQELTLWQKLTNPFRKLLGLQEHKSYYFGVCSRNLEIKPDDNYQTTFDNNGKPSAYKQSDFWYAARKYELEQKLPVGYAIQGELIGPRIQSNHELVNDLEFYVFDIWDISKQVYLQSAERLQFVKSLGIPHVPFVGYTKIFQECKNLDELLERVEGESMNPRTISEGRVYKHIDNPEVTFKCISNSYLLKCEA